MTTVSVLPAPSRRSRLRSAEVPMHGDGRRAVCWHLTRESRRRVEVTPVVPNSETDFQFRLRTPNVNRFGFSCHRADPLEWLARLSDYVPVGYYGTLGLILMHGFRMLYRPLAAGLAAAADRATAAARVPVPRPARA